MRSIALSAVFMVAGCATSTPRASTSYLDEWMARFPTRATASGLSRFDEQLEDFGKQEREDWIAVNKRTITRAERELAASTTTRDRRLDLELIVREAKRNVFEFETLRRPDRDPLFWTRIVSNASVFLLVRDDRPKNERLEAVAARAALIPRLMDQAQRTLAATGPSEIPKIWCELGARQARASSTFFREGLARAGKGHSKVLQDRLRVAGEAAAKALDAFAEFLDTTAVTAAGSPRLGKNYSTLFHIVTGDRRPLDKVLSNAHRALAAKREEAATYARTAWRDVFGDEPIPADASVVLERMFDRLGEDRAQTINEFIDDYRTLLDASIRFVKTHDIVTMPEPLTLQIDRSPGYFIGQSVGGVYPAGPFNPESDTLLFLPTPPADAPAAAKDAFFRDFNHHFNVMIMPHEIIPGHYLQLKYAARHPNKVRAMFSDGVYVEGWGTFCERLMLDNGWGDPLDRMAHYKKQLENIARTVVDIQVHTQGMSRDEVLAFVRDDALQDDQFASNMWVRALTSSPQLTFYWLGYEAVYGLFSEVKATAEKENGRFELRQFTDGMMELGPVPVRHYRALLGVKTASMID